MSFGRICRKVQWFRLVEFVIVFVSILFGRTCTKVRRFGLVEFVVNVVWSNIMWKSSMV